MKLTLTNYEAEGIVANKYNMSPEDVEIKMPPPLPAQVKQDINNNEIRNALCTIFDEGRAVGRGKHLQTLTLVKAIRTLTNAGLFDAKQMADQMNLPF